MTEVSPHATLRRVSTDRVRLVGKIIWSRQRYPVSLLVLNFNRGPLPAKYMMGVRVSGISSRTTVEIFVDTYAYVYGFYLFPGNAWQVIRSTSSAGSNQIILQGSYTSANSYVLAISLNGATSTFAINGVPVSYTETAPSPAGSPISFSIAAPCGTTTDYADFQDFSVSPLS